MKKIGMVVALEKELKAFLEKQTVEIKEEKSGAFSVIELTLFNFYFIFVISVVV